VERFQLCVAETVLFFWTVQMPNGMTDRGQKMLLEFAFGETTVPASYKLKLVTDSSVTREIQLFSELSECPAGSGYVTGGISFDSTDLSFGEDEGTISARATLADNTAQWVATGGFPVSGTGVTFCVVTDGSTDDNVIAFFDLDGAETMTEGGVLTVDNIEFQINEPT
tara:strand:- start:495 stop:998 length:504 start_codon:yes stop_codon:yes gene_type:complete